MSLQAVKNVPHDDGICEINGCFVKIESLRFYGFAIEVLRAMLALMKMGRKSDGWAAKLTE